MENSYPINCADAAAYLHLSKTYLYRLVYLGKIACHKPSGGKLFFKKEDLDAFCFQNRRAANFEHGIKPSKGQNKTTVGKQEEKRNVKFEKQDGKGAIRQ